MNTEQLYMDMQVQRDAWRSLASFYRSVIQSGEGWTETCELEWKKAERARGIR